MGALAATTALEYGYDTVGIVLGIEIPILLRFEIGYRAGIKWAVDRYNEITARTRASACSTYTPVRSTTRRAARLLPKRCWPRARASFTKSPALRVLVSSKL